MTFQRNHHQSMHFEKLLPLASWEWDIRLNHVVISDNMYHMFGVSKYEFEMDKHFKDYIHEEDREFVIQAMDHAFAEKGSFFIEYRILRSDGEVRIIQEKGEVILGERDNVIGMIGILFDVTDLKRPSSSFNLDYPITLADRKARYGHWEWDIANRKLYLSREASLIFGLNPNETHTYYKDTLLKLVHPSDYKRLIEAINNAPTLGYINIEYVTKTVNDCTAIVHVNGEIIKDNHQTPIRMLGTVRNISHLIKKEQVMLKTEKLSIVSQLAAGVAHEILNPLTSIRGFITLLKSKEALVEDEYFNIMDEEIERVEFIVNELLMLAKPRVFQFSVHDIQDIVKSAVAFIKDDLFLKGIKLVTHFQPDLPHLNCEKSQLRQVFINLLRNAIESMDHSGTITVTITMRTADKMEILIDDEGCGIPLHLLTKAGEPFYTTKEKGTGLGLMVCHRIIENHAGTLVIERKREKGTLVKMIIPINY